jgi:hypothetical protein
MIALSATRSSCSSSGLLGTSVELVRVDRDDEVRAGRVPGDGGTALFETTGGIWGPALGHAGISCPDYLGNSGNA